MQWHDFSRKFAGRLFPNHRIPMNQLTKLFLTALLVSFLGSLPLGTSNVTITHLTVREGLQAAAWFAIGATLVEVAYVRIAMMAMKWILKQQKLFRFFEWLTLALILLLAIGSFRAAIAMSGLGSVLPAKLGNPFLLGTIISATNPLHVTFWFGWSTSLLDKKILVPDNRNYNIYIAGIGIGSILGYAVFAFGGTLLVDKLNANQNILNWVIGAILGITFFVQLYKMLSKPALAKLRQA